MAVAELCVGIDTVILLAGAERVVLLGDVLGEVGGDHLVELLGSALPNERVVLLGVAVVVVGMVEVVVLRVVVIVVVGMQEGLVRACRQTSPFRGAAAGG